MLGQSILSSLRLVPQDNREVGSMPTAVALCICPYDTEARSETDDNAGDGEGSPGRSKLEVGPAGAELHVRGWLPNLLLIGAL